MSEHLADILSNKQHYHIAIKFYLILSMYLFNVQNFKLGKLI